MGLRFETFISILCLASISCTGMEVNVPIGFESQDSAKFRVNIHERLNLSPETSLRPFQLFQYFAITERPPGYANFTSANFDTGSLEMNTSSSFGEGKPDVSSVTKSPYSITPTEDSEITRDSITEIVAGDFEPAMRQIQATNLKQFQDFIESKEFAKTVETIGKPANYEMGWTLKQIQSSYVAEIRDDIRKANPELLLVYKRMLNSQIYNMLDMLYKIRFDTTTIQKDFLLSSVLELWNLRIEIIDEMNRRGK